MSKHQAITSLLKRRIRRGDYKTRPFPSTVKFAAELNIHRNTAAKAMAELVADGLLIKTDTGRISPAEIEERTRLHLAMVAPSFSTPTVSGRFASIKRLAENRDWDIRMIGYEHDNDPVIYEAIDGYDGLFLVPLNDDLPPAVIDKLKASGTKAVVLFEDLSGHGLPSLPFENPASVDMLLDHLYELGHRSVACLNTQPSGQVVTERIRHWEVWKGLHKVSGPLLDEPVEHFEHPMPRARSVVHRLLEEGRFDVDALFCTTGATAIGAMRAMADHGLVPGRDIAVCAADGDGYNGQHFNPSLTFVSPPSSDPYWEMCLDWFGGDEEEWPWPMVMTPTGYELFIGEATDPEKRSSAARQLSIKA